MEIIIFLIAFLIAGILAAIKGDPSCLAAIGKFILLGELIIAALLLFSEPILGIVVTLLFIIILISYNQISKNQTEDHTYINNIIEEYNVPENYYKAVIYYGIKCNLQYYTPVIMWISSERVKILTLGTSPFIIERYKADFKKIETAGIINLCEDERYWYNKSSEIKREFAKYVTVYQKRNYNKANPWKTVAYKFGSLVFCADSLQSIFEMLNEPSSFYEFNGFYRNYIIQLIPRITESAEKLRLIQSVFDTSPDYMTAQEKIFSLNQKGILNNDEVAELLEKSRHKYYD